MDEQIIATYCLCDDLLQAMHHHAIAQGRMSNAEVMTTAFIASLRFGQSLSARLVGRRRTQGLSFATASPSSWTAQAVIPGVDHPASLRFCPISGAYLGLGNENTMWR